MNNSHLIEAVIFIFAVLAGFFPAAAVLPHCDDIDNNIYDKLHGLRIVVAIIIALIAVIGIVDLLGLSKKPKQARQAKAFATGIALGMTSFQIIMILMNSNCFRESWILAIPSW